MKGILAGAARGRILGIRRAASPPATSLATCLAASHDIRAAIRDYQQRRWRNAAAATLMARNMGAMGQWKGHTVCTARNTLIRSIPLSLQLRQFDLVLGAPTARKLTAQNNNSVSRPEAH
ncbi:MAG TPA: hypothetical protein VHJ18_16455 [Streptosporangiaceae bacterium]|jgi:2-polyprenyl-6-methoxyphenol hydroxylase-like FAD-dependent oxidoreductase|nr:hypothetical protein [Streptosporangiaceae bacterium]